jgi:hypothetical protein
MNVLYVLFLRDATFRTIQNKRNDGSLCFVFVYIIENGALTFPLEVCPLLSISSQMSPTILARLTKEHIRQGRKIRCMRRRYGDIKITLVLVNDTIFSKLEL